ncbi:MAG TPA: site-specific integrase [Pirellulales bacterium]|nr:site-specific integrase [Pirellulales bacterium]
MATLQERNGSFRILFVYHGKRETFTLGRVARDEAESKASQVEYLLMRLKQGLISIPPATGIVDFLLYDGKSAPGPAPIEADSKAITLARLREKYLATHEASLEPSTIATTRLHFRNVAKSLGEGFPVAELSLADLQKHVDRRAKAKGAKGRKLSPTTIRKEIDTLRGAWNWAVKMKLVAGRFPNDGLRFPKTSEKPAFMTKAEIERQIAAGGLTEAEIAEFWDSLYLTVDDLADLLAHVKQAAKHGFLHPMVCFAAHTGARRSEIVRIRLADLDLSGQTVTIRERKRVKGKTTTRRVPLSPHLVDVLKGWLAIHPGGPWLFCHGVSVDRSRTRSRTTGHKGKERARSLKERMAGVKQRGAVAIAALTRDEAHDHLKRVLKDSPWKRLRGWHALRHSFVSACASRGVDQRLVEAWAGHMSPEMSRRYAHLWPSVQQEALAKVFG